MTERLCIGVVVGAHGVKGAVRIKPFTEDPADLTSYGPLSTETGQKWRLKGASIDGKGVVTAKIDGVEDRNQAEALKGAKLFIERGALPEAEEDEFYIADLIGLPAESLSGEPLGIIKAVFDFGAGEIVEVAGDQGSILVPFTKAAVPVVDIKAKRVVIDPPVLVDAGRESEEEDQGPDGN
ncbi:MAG: 16S rRNA processing protein RimM [Hyphomicrobiales bacterium]|nr:16S rRNA processing protein RimM [Hyphomicrobiales bacterium]